MNRVYFLDKLFIALKLVECSHSKAAVSWKFGRCYFLRDFFWCAMQ